MSDEFDGHINASLAGYGLTQEDARALSEEFEALGLIVYYHEGGLGVSFRVRVRSRPERTRAASLARIRSCIQKLIDAAT